jgi:iron complex outermembrane receptor protein
MSSVGTARAEEPSELNEITVTATKTPRKQEQVPAAVDVVSQETVEESRGWNVGETLEALPGVQAQSTNGAYDTHLIIRGAGAKALYGVREIMIMVDGVPVTDPDSLTRLDMVDPSLIERIEVVKGPNSTLYGANASGGVVNIITKSPLAAQGFRGEAAGGSYGSRSLELQYGGSVGNLFYLLSGTHRATDSWRDWNEFSSSQINGRFQYLLGDSADLDLSLSYTDADLKLPGRLTEEAFAEDPSQQTAEWVNMARDSEVFRLALAYRQEFDRFGELKTQLYLQDWYHFHPVPAKINDGGAMVFGFDAQQDVPFSLGGLKNLLSLGVSLQQDNRDSEAYAYADLNTTTVNGKTVAIAPFTNSDREGDLLEEVDNTVGKWGVFVQESLWLGEGTILDLGLRYDQVNFDINTEVYGEWGYVTTQRGTSFFNYREHRETIDIDRTWDAVSPRIGLTHSLSDPLSAYATVATGFQTPTQGELESNTALEPQEAINYEVGLKGRFKAGHTFDVALFHTTIKDEIIQLLDEMGSSYYDNAGETLHQGVELSGRWSITDRISLLGSYTYSDFTFEDYDEMERAGYPPRIVTNSRDGNRIPLVPEHQFSLGIGYHHPAGFYGKLSSTTWGEYYVDTANTETYEGFTTVAAGIGYTQGPFGLRLQVDNVMDEDYAAEVVKSYGKTRYSPAAPRTFTAGISYAF